MSVKRYLTELVLQFDIDDELEIKRKIKYETYASNPEDAETTTRMFVSDMSKKLTENTNRFVSDKLYEFKSVPSIEGPIKVIETHRHHDYMDSDANEVGLVYTDD